MENNKIQVIYDETSIVNNEDIESGKEITLPVRNKPLKTNITIKVKGGSGSGSFSKIKLAPLRENGVYNKLHFVQVKSLLNNDITNYYDTGISLENTKAYIEKAEILYDYKSTNSAWFGYKTTSIEIGFGIWGNTILRVMHPTITAPYSTQSLTYNEWYNVYQVKEATGQFTAYNKKLSNGAIRQMATREIGVITDENTILLGACAGSNEIPRAFGIIKIKDDLTDEYILNATPMKDDSGGCWLYDDEKQELTKLPNGWIAGEVVSGGIEITGDGYDTITANIKNTAYGVEIDKIFPSSNTRVEIPNFDLGSKNIPNYALYYRFYNRATKVPNINFYGSTIGEYGLSYCLYTSTSDLTYIDVNMPNLTSVSTRSLERFAYGSTTYSLPFRDITIGKLGTTLSVNTYSFNSAFYSKSNLRNVKVNGVKSVSTTYAFGYAFAGTTSNSDTCTLDGDFAFTELTSATGANSFQYCFQNRKFDVNNAKVINPFPVLETISGGSSFSYCFAGSTLHQDSIFVFPKVKNIGTNASSCCTYLFSNTRGHWKYCWWLSLEQIGYAGNVYQFFSSGLSAPDGVASNGNTYQMCFPSLKKILSTYTGTTASYGNFSGCTGMGKVWMPLLSEITGKAQQNSLFNSCTGLKEIHFGIENETYIKSLTGYATKFGATNSTIYFDLVNHIVVNGITYDRDGADYIVGTTHQTDTSYNFTHPNDRYSWKDSNGNIIYTMECWTPQVSDNVYDDEDNVIGTITAIS